MDRIIHEGDRNKQGTHKCPNCGRTVTRKMSYGDPPQCPCCKVPYRPIQKRMRFYS